MAEVYFLGREPTGDNETGPDGGECYDGRIWCVETDEPNPTPVVVCSIDSDEEATLVLKVIQDRVALLAACDALWAEREAQQSDQAACRRLYNAWKDMNEARCRAKGLM